MKNRWQHIIIISSTKKNNILLKSEFQGIPLKNYFDYCLWLLPFADTSLKMVLTLGVLTPKCLNNMKKDSCYT